MNHVRAREKVSNPAMIRLLAEENGSAGQASLHPSPHAVIAWVVSHFLDAD